MAKNIGSASAIDVTPAGRVRRVNRERAINVKVSDDELARFNNAIMLDAAIHGGEPNASRTIRALMRVFCERTEATNESDEGKQAAKVLRKRARS